MALFFDALNMAGTIMNGQAQAKAQVDQAKATTADLIKQIAFEADQRTQKIDFQGQTLGEMLTVERSNLTNEIASKERILQAQQSLIANERDIQQNFARGARDVLDASTGLFKNYSGQIDERTGSMAKTFMDTINGATPGATAQPAAVPEASGSSATANRETAQRDDRAGRITQEATKLAGVKSFGDLLGKTQLQQGRNSQIADILQNFARGSQATLDPAMQAAGMSSFTKQNFIDPGKYIGEQYVGGAIPSGQASGGIGDLFRIAGVLGSSYVASGGKMPSFGSSDRTEISPPTSLVPAGLSSGLGFKATWLL
jgi:hypothetical protein